MILYFSATGNSKYVAREISKSTGDNMVPLKDLINDNEDLVINKGENFGVVVPTYFYGLPSILTDYLKKTNIVLKGNNYCFFVATYGKKYGNVLAMANAIFKDKGITMDSMFTARFVDNYAPYFDLNDNSKNASALKNGEEETLSIVSHIKHKDKVLDIAPQVTKDEFIKMRNKYDEVRSTKGFSVDKEKCKKCGLCSRVCPTSTITMKNGYPCWNSENCTLCLGCYHRCKSSAINFMNCSKNGQYINIKVSLD